MLMKYILRQLTGTVRTGVGNPGEMVISTAKKEHADVIICGCRGLGKLRRTFTGTVSDYIVHHSHVPVVVCRHPSHKDEKQNQKWCHSSPGQNRKLREHGETVDENQRIVKSEYGKMG